MLQPESRARHTGPVRDSHPPKPPQKQPQSRMFTNSGGSNRQGTDRHSGDIDKSPSCDPPAVVKLDNEKHGS